VRSRAELWVAALRCRDPRGENQELLNQFGPIGPDAFVPAKYTSKPEAVRAARQVFSAHGVPPLLLVTEPPLANRDALLLFPTVLLHDSRSTFWFTPGCIDQLWLQHRESYLAFQAMIMVMYISSTGTYWQGSWDVLFDPDVPLGGNGVWLVALALCAKQKEASRLALDALVCSIDDGRMDGRTFGSVLGQLSDSENISFKRWVGALEEVAKISPLHQQFTVDSLEALIAHLPLPDKDRQAQVQVLELLLETCITSGEVIQQEATRNYLKAITSKGKAATIAKQLLLLESSGKTVQHRRTVATQVVELRIQRAERWQAMLNGTRQTELIAT
jgi:hypothetical protein